jgi:hypothetical protein
VNSDKTHHRLEYFHADGLDYNDYEKLPDIAVNPYGADGRNLRLQHTAYPYTDDEGTAHDALTDDTTPAAILFNGNADGARLMGKPVKDIRETDGRISFCFYESGAAGLFTASASDQPAVYYDLLGRRIAEPSSGLYIIRYADGTTQKKVKMIR